MRLANKVAIITGAASGMGRAAVQRFAAEGADVVGCDINDDGGEETIELTRNAGGRAEFMHVDVTVEADVRDLVARTVKDHGALNVIFNNVGFGEYSNVIDSTEEEFYRMVDVNLKGMFFGSKYALAHMVDNGGGSIVSTASITATRGQDGLGLYGAAKAGVINLTQYIAWAYGPKGVRANCICPGAIDTPMLRAGIGTPGYDKVMTYFKHQAPLHRVGQPEDIANAALFFASDDSAHVTGQALAVDGGMTCGTFLDADRLVAFASEILG